MKNLILIAFVLTSNICLAQTGGDSLKCVFLGEVTKIKSTQISGAKYEITIAVDSIISKGPIEPFNDPFYEKGKKQLFATIYTSRSLNGCETNNCSTCGFIFELEKDYIIYINENSHGIHIVNGCGETKLIAKN
mgnify:CR=1 FL=1